MVVTLETNVFHAEDIEDERGGRVDLDRGENGEDVVFAGDFKCGETTGG